MKATKTATKEISAPVINRVVSRETGHCLGYLVKSNSTEGYYQITWNHSRHQYQCTCKATVKCCHIKAVESVLAAKKQLSAPRHLAKFFEAMAAFTEAEETHLNRQEAEMLERLVDDEPKREHVAVTVSTLAPVVTVAKSQPIVSAKATRPLGSNKVFSLMR